MSWPGFGLRLAACGVILSAVACSPPASESRWTEGQQGIVARGALEASGRQWALAVEVRDGSICLGFIAGDGCGPIPDRADALQTMGTERVSEDPEGDYACAYGAVSETVSRVAVVFDDGAQLNAQLVAAPGWSARFFVGCVERTVGVRNVTLFDSDGLVLSPTR